MTLDQALAIAAWAKPKQPGRIPMDKLQRGGNALAQHVSGVAALGKSFTAMGGTVANLQKRLDQVAADLDHIQNSPGEKRIIH